MGMLTANARKPRLLMRGFGVQFRLFSFVLVAAFKIFLAIRFVWSTLFTPHNYVTRLKTPVCLGTCCRRRALALA